MTRNPYSPPVAVLDTGALPSPRPPGVWLLIAVLCLAIAVFMVGAGRLVLAAVQVPAKLLDFSFVITLTWRSGLVAAFALGVLLIFRRTAAGRWYGICVFAASATRIVTLPELWQNNGGAEVIGSTLFCLLAILLFSSWAYVFAWSKSAKLYFKPRSTRGA